MEGTGTTLSIVLVFLSAGFINDQVLLALTTGFVALQSRTRLAKMVREKDLPMLSLVKVPPQNEHLCLYTISICIMGEYRQSLSG